MKISLSRKFTLVCSALLLVGCHKLEATTRIEANGSGELRMETGFSTEERENLEKQNPNQQDFCNTSQAPTNVTVTEEEQRGEETWCITTAPFENLNELRSLYGQREGIQINRLEISEGRFYYNVDLDTSSEESNFSTLTELTWSVILPGTPLTHNAEQVDGNTLTWKPASKSGIVNMQAESEVPQSGFPFPPCSAAVVFGLGVSLILLRQRRKELLLQ